MYPPFFSIIIPTKNRPDMLRRALLSVKSQTLSNYEVIVVDDGSSTDNQIAYDVIKNKKRLTVKKNLHSLGVSAARNLGAETASGHWLIFLDDDDEFLPNCLADRFEAMQNSDPNVAFSWCNVIHKETYANQEAVEVGMTFYQAKYTNEPILYSKIFSVGAGYGLSVKRSVFIKIGGFNKNYSVAEDTDLLLRLVKGGYSPLICVTPGVYVHHHYNERLTRASRSSLGIVEKLKQDHLDLFLKYNYFWAYFFCWGARTHYEEKNFWEGDKLVIEMLLRKWYSFFVIHHVIRTLFTYRFVK